MKTKFLDQIYEKTLEYSKYVSKDSRKKIGQFFTSPSVAMFMANMMYNSNTHIKILDAGAGSGILITALCEKIICNPQIEEITAILYENDPTILPLLRENMDYLKLLMAQNNKEFYYEIKAENFILHNAPYWSDTQNLSEENLFDIVISNPPYKKLRKSDPESMIMSSVVHGQPNIYFLFMSMAARLLKPNGELIFINPRSFTSGAYFRKFREWFFNNMKLTHLHLFISRKDVFNCDDVLQETIILRAIKTTENIDFIKITESENLLLYDSTNISEHIVPYDVVIDFHSNNFYMKIPTNEHDINILKLVNTFPETLESLGYKLKTGPVVDFRSTDFLCDKENEHTVPLFWAYNFLNSQITYPIFKETKPQYILNIPDSKKLLVENKNYLFIKRFTSKEESKRIQPAFYLANNFNFDSIGIENHLNYLVKDHGDMTIQELYGLFVLLNSSILDRYYRILNGSTQVNAGEINSMPLPKKEDIINFGKLAINLDKLTVDECDKIICQVIKTEYLRKVV